MYMGVEEYYTAEGSCKKYPWTKPLGAGNIDTPAAQLARFASTEGCQIYPEVLIKGMDAKIYAMA